ncbi:MAG: hypothetical protein M8860_01730 [marine benthic group bacterium]|nr:hypothetical protein [Candidatus Carthagonibacter metallireducens]MCL7985096.1 hypothetical protein [Gemmatimonadota bacterium]
MYRLSLLGGVLLVGPDGPVGGRASQQKRLALLALIASAGEKGVSRDRAVGLLWPESGTQEARHHLSHSLYVLRKALGEETLQTTGEFIRLNPGRIEVDVREFDRLVESGEKQSAARTYAGPFMDGFHLDSSSEFDRWAENERRRLASAYARLLEELARTADDQGDAPAAATWWGRLVEHDPYNSAAVTGFMSALAAGGDPANALQVAHEHAELLKRDFDMEPAPEVQELADRLARASGDRTWAAKSGASLPAVSVVGIPERGESPPKRIARAVISTVFATAVLVALWSAISGRESGGGLISNAVMVRPTENLSGDASLDELGRWATYQVSNALAGIDTIRIVSSDEVDRILKSMEGSERLAGPALTRELTRQTRTALVLESSLFARNDSVLLESRLMDAETAEVLDGVIGSASLADPTAGILAWRDRVLVAVATRLRLGDQYSPSFGRGLSYPAWQQLNAARELWILGGSERQALELLHHAIEIDSTFDAALGLAMIWYMNFGELATADSIANELDRRLAFLSPRQRWQLAVQNAVLRRDRPEMVRAFRDWKDRLPNASRYLHLALGHRLAFQPGECLAALDSVDLEGSRYARSSMLWEYRAACHHSLGEFRQGLDQALEGRARFPQDLDLAFREAQGLAATGDAGAALRTVDEILSEPAAEETFQHDRRFRLLVDVALEMRAHGSPESASDALERAVSWYDQRASRETVTAGDRWRLARALYAAGRWEEASEAFANLTVEELVADPTLLRHNIDISLLGYRGVLAARLGDANAAGSIDAELAGLDRPWLWGHAEYWRSAIAAVRGESAAAASHMSRAMNLGLFAAQWGAEYPKWDFHVDPDFESVRELAPFRELVGPRG